MVWSWQYDAPFDRANEDHRHRAFFEQGVQRNFPVILIFERERGRALSDGDFMRLRRRLPVRGQGRRKQRARQQMAEAEEW